MVQLWRLLETRLHDKTHLFLIGVEAPLRHGLLEQRGAGLALDYITTKVAVPICEDSLGELSTIL